MSCHKCEEEKDPCLENCGCDIEITSLACIRHSGSDLPCIEVVKGETLEAIIQKINDKICELSPGLDGDDGEDGQGVDHVSFTGEPGTEGQPGQTSQYTIWGDAAETINLGTFVVYNGVDGQGIDHTSFTSTDGPVPTAGAPGQTDTYTLWADPLETISLGTFVVYNGSDGSGYDSGWIPMNNFNSNYNFGLPAYTNGWVNPNIRVIDKTVYLCGFTMLPLSDDAVNGSTLLTDVAQYPDEYRVDNRIYSGFAGGFDVINDGIMRSNNPILPQVLAPSCTHILRTHEMVYRPLNDIGGKYELNLTSLLPQVTLNTDGTLELITVSKTNEEASAPSIIPNSPFHQIISRVTRGLIAPDYTPFFTEYDGAAALDKRQSPTSNGSYPDAFDGRKTSDLGGFKVLLTTSYPIGENITLAQVQQAIAQIQE